MGGELALLLALGTAWYWAQQDVNSRDWDFDVSWESWRDKFTGDAVRLDDNPITTNIVGHPVADAGYYLVARANGYAPLESFLFTLAASAVWEYLLEFREVVSLNDQVFTPVGGTVIGEVVYQLGEFFTRSADTPATRLLAWVFGAAQNVHRWWDGTPAARAALTDRFGFRDDRWHQFDLSSGVGVAADTGIVELGLETQIFHLLEAGARPGHVSTFLDRLVFTQMFVQASLDAGGLQDLSLFLKATLFGYAHQRRTHVQPGRARGVRVVLGPATAFEFNTHTWSATGIEDIYGITHLLGPSLDLVYDAGALRLRLTLDGYGDFAAIRAFALDAFTQVGSLQFAKAVLRSRQYYYAIGLTTRAQATLTAGGLEVGVSGRYSAYDSIEGVDRRQEEITNDVQTTDTVGAVHLWMGYALGSDVLHVAVSYERRWRAGRASDSHVTVRVSATEDRILGALRMRF